MLLIFLSIAWVIGTVLGSKISLPLWALSVAIAPLPLVWLFRHHKKQILIISLCLLALFGGAIRYQSSLPVVTKSTLQYYNDTGAVEIKGVIARDPDIRDRNVQIELTVSEVKTGNVWQKVTGKLLLFAPRYPAYHYGDVLMVTGTLESPQKSDSFDYPGYLANQAIYSTMSYPAVTLIDAGKGFKPLGWLYSARGLLAQKMSEILPEPQASLAQGIILGIRGNIPQSLNNDFTRTGTTHILAISGLNLNIIAGILVSTGIWLFGKRRYLYIWLTLSAIWFYTLLTGVNHPVVRSALMLSLFLIADLLGRQRSVMTALAFAAGIMVALNPRILWDASFQLSFLAMLGLVYTVPPLQSLGRRAVTATLGEEGFVSTTVNWLTDSLAVTLGVTIIVWPVIAGYFNIFSIVSPLATMLVLPVLPAIMIASSLAALLGIIALPIGHLVGWVAWLFLSYMLSIINGFARLPVSSIATSRIDPAIVWGYFAVLTIVLWSYPRHHRLAGILSRGVDFLAGIPKKWVMPPLLTMMVLSTLIAASMPDNKLHVSFLDVGQGDAILIQTPDHQDILVDGGPSPQSLNLDLGRRLPFWDRTIELVVLTHPHADHLMGLIDILQRYKVGQVLYPETDSTSPLWLEFTSLIQKKHIPATVAVAGQTIDLGNQAVSIEVLHSPGNEKDATLDSQGIVLRLSDSDISFLLTADIDQTVETELLSERAPLASTVLKVAHHGSDTSTSAGFLAVVNPGIAVISVGANNDFGHPSPEVLTRLTDKIGEENIYRTDKNGTIELVTDGERLWLKKDK